ncbi:6-phosphogluconolactonase [Candidatus Nitronereus thalassa]|uniref:6-phosphogluconolactonase n=1 Tax=Candidatus Nitronereus thalassa TaxID=3020898 RepID=A0ABU3K7U3_9BACT|nr:6-phosphogluconolactonase [Candidatus Nitronereus thalassa]MDT7042429.1 6-phosphogluconolactonase [Candidatus Nitronereus thalassa]
MNSPNSNVCVYPTLQALTTAAAEHVIHQASLAINLRKKFTIALAGGSTPKNLYALLASPEYRTRLDWEKVEFFWGDERHVPPDHADSNYRMAHEAILGPLQIPETHIHRIQGELADAQEAANRYESLLRNRLASTDSAIPQLDLVLLGMGPDGHTASLFPGTDAVHESTRLVVAPWVEKFQTFRITMTPALINHAYQVTFLISGGEKAQVLREVKEGPYQPDALPSQVIKPLSGHLTWLLDQEAASNLSTQQSD